MKQKLSYKEETQAEYDRIIMSFRGTAIAAASMLAGGTIFFHYVQKLSWLDALYFCTISLATVGYGDIVPATPAGKIFIMVYVLVGIGIIATFANLIVRRAVLRRELRRIKSGE